MSFQCSIFGHKYGEAEVTREREENGSEVVTTIRETETCVRCGEQRVVSENKEITTLETAADIVADDLEENEGTEDAEEAVGSETPEEGDSPAASGDVTVPDAEGHTPGVAPSETPDAAEDDGIILDANDANDDADAEAEDGREPGEWPEEPEEGDDWQPSMGTTDGPGPDVESTGNAVTVPDGEYHCPECSYTTPVEESSLREGDFCPECHRGALEHRP